MVRSIKAVSWLGLIQVCLGEFRERRSVRPGQHGGFPLKCLRACR